MDEAEGELLAESPGAILGSHAPPLLTAAWSPAGDIIAAGTNDRAYVFELDEERENGKVRHTLGGLRD